jgi:hypothetical protein
MSRIVTFLASVQHRLAPPWTMHAFDLSDSSSLMIVHSIARVFVRGTGFLFLRQDNMSWANCVNIKKDHT